MNEEIQAGLKNALDRGENIDKAIRSFVNAGYNASEVQEAAASLSEGALSATTQRPENNQPKDKPKERLSVQSLPESSPPAATAQTATVDGVPAPQQSNEEDTKPKNKKFLWISIISLTLIIIGGIIAYILLK